MKVLCILVVGILLSFPSYAQDIKSEEKYHTEWLLLDDDGRQPFKEYYKDGKLKAEGFYRNNYLDGPYKEYYSNENLKWVLHYKESKEHGDYREYFKNGKLRKKGLYEEGKLTGPFKTYYENGKLKQNVNFQNGVTQGKAFIYHGNGNIKQELIYVDGKYNGLFKEYYPTGKLHLESNYQDDKREGPYVMYYENGRVLGRGFFNNDKLNNLNEVYYDSGTLQESTIYKDGVIDGIRKEYYDSGIIKYVDEYVNGIKESSQEYDATGEIIKERDSSSEWRVEERKEFNFSDLTWLHYVFLILSALAGMLVSLLLLKPFNQKGDEKQTKIIPSPMVTKEMSQDEEELYIPSLKKDIQGKESKTVSDMRGLDKEFNPLHAESETMYRRLTETVESGIFMADAKGKLVYANHTFAKNLGYETKAEIIGLNIERELFNSKGETGEFLSKLELDHHIHDYEFHHKWQDGQEVILSASANHVRNDRGEIIGIVGVLRDITQKSQLENALVTEKRKLEQIINFFEKIDSIREFDTLVDFVVDGVKSILESGKCSLMLMDSETQELYIQGARGISEGIIQSTRIKLGEPIAGIIVKNRKPLLVENIEYDERFKRAKGPEYLGRSFIIVPLELDEKFIGVINVADKSSEVLEGKPFNEIDLKILTAIASKVALAIDNIEIYKGLNILTVTDPITQIFNYRLLSESLDHEIKRFKRREGNLCISLIDIDKFKSYNDSFGHLAGDELLKEFSSLLKRELRDTDIVCRYAGDEFCVVFPDTDVQGAQQACEKVRKAVEEMQFKAKVTISQGIAKYSAGMTKKEFIDHADKALYQAKREGRNKVIIYE